MSGSPKFSISDTPAPTELQGEVLKSIRGMSKEDQDRAREKIAAAFAADFAGEIESFLRTLPLIRLLKGGFWIEVKSDGSRGRPKRKIDPDQFAVDWMTAISQLEGEAKAETLARRMVVFRELRHGASEPAAIKRLARKFRARKKSEQKRTRI